MSDSSLGLVVPEEQGNTGRLMSSKGLRDNLKGLTPTKSGIILASKKKKSCKRW